MATMRFTCGHEADIPAYMGRGKARERRLSQYFGRRCFICAVDNYREFVKTLSKDKHGTHYSEDEQRVKVKTKIQSLRPTY